MNFLHFPGDLNCRPLSLSDLGSDNRSIQAIYACNIFHHMLHSFFETFESQI